MVPQNKRKVTFTDAEIQAVLTCKNKHNNKILTDIIKFISTCVAPTLKDCNPGMFDVMLKAVFQGRR